MSDLTKRAAQHGVKTQHDTKQQKILPTKKSSAQTAANSVISHVFHAFGLCYQQERLDWSLVRLLGEITIQLQINQLTH